MPDNTVACICLPRSATIEEVEKRLNARLILNCWVLPRSRSIEYLGLTPFSDLKSSSPDTLFYRVRASARDSVTLAFPRKSSVEENLHASIARILGIPRNLQTLYVSKPMHRDGSLMHTKRYVNVFTPNDLLFTVFSTKSLRKVVLLPHSSCISDLKRAIAHKFKDSCVRLLYECIEIEADEEPLSTYFQQRESCVTAVLSGEVVATIVNSKFDLLVGVALECTVSELITRIEKARTFSRQPRLTYQNRMMKGSDTLRQHGITEDFVANLAGSDEELIEFRAASGEAFTAILPCSQLNISRVSSIVEQRTGVAQHSLSWSGELSDDQPLHRYGLSEDSALVFTQCLDTSSPQRIAIKYFGTEIFSFEVNGSMTIADLKHEIDKRGVYQKARLIIARTLADDHAQLRDFPLHKQDELELVLPDVRIVTITLPKGDCFTIGLSAKMNTLKTLKKQIEERINIPVRLQRLAVRGWELCSDNLPRFGVYEEISLQSKAEFVLVDRVSATNVP